MVLHTHHSSPGIKCIKEGHTVLFELPDILQAFMQHYEKVFTNQEPSLKSYRALQECLFVVRSRLPEAQRDFCDQILTIDDIKKHLLPWLTTKLLIVILFLMNL